MIRFDTDYTEGGHPKILEKLVQSNLEQTPGYGIDHYCQSAAAKIKKAIQNENAAIHLVPGGTIGNIIVISSILRTHEGVISSSIGHIHVHESGAIESAGHKILAIQPKDGDGKITVEQIKAYLYGHQMEQNIEQCCKPGMVYLTHPTENGALYSLAELESINHVCHEYNVPIYIDGARLAHGLASPKTDLSLIDIARLTDVFLLGGTKCGGLFGEAIVITNPKLQSDFRYIIKQKGGMLAKGRMLGIQFDVLFTDGLYMALGRHAVEMALRIKDAFQRKGYPLFTESYTNQQYPIVPDDKIVELRKRYAFLSWERVDSTHTCIRICTSWATPEESVNQFVKDIEAL